MRRYVAGMKLDDFDFDLPEALIATRPASPRSSARLLVAEGDAIHDQVVTDLVSWLRPGDLLVLNDTRVIPARLIGRKPSGGRVELLLLEREGSTRIWQTLLKCSRKPNGCRNGLR